MRAPSLVLAVALMGSQLVGCRAPAPAPRANSSQKTQQIQRHALPSLIPAPGILFLIELKPAELMSNRALRKQWDLLLRSDRLEAFQKVSGLDLNKIQSLWIAGYPLGTLVLFDAISCGAQVEQAFLARASSLSERPSSLPGARLLTGIVNNEPQALFHLPKDFIALAYADITLAKIVQAYAEGRLHAKTALDTRFLSPLAPLHSEAKLRAFLVGPFEQATDVVAQGFAAGLAAFIPNQNNLTLQLVARGVWPDDADPAINTWFQQLLNTREARALGFGFPIDAASVHCSAENQDGNNAANIDLRRCQTELGYDSAALAEAIYRVTQGSSEQLLANDPRAWQSQILGSEPAPP